MSLLISGVLIVNYGSCSNLLAAPISAGTTQSYYDPSAKFYREVNFRTKELEKSPNDKKPQSVSELLEYLKERRDHGQRLTCKFAINIINALFCQDNSNVDMIANILDDLQSERIVITDFYLNTSTSKFITLLNWVVKVRQNQNRDIISNKFSDTNGMRLNYTRKIIKRGGQYIQNLCKNNCAKFKELPKYMKLQILEVAAFDPDTCGQAFKNSDPRSVIAEDIERTSGCYGVQTNIDEKDYYEKIFGKKTSAARVERGEHIQQLCNKIIAHDYLNDSEYIEAVRNLINYFEGNYDEIVRCCWSRFLYLETISNILSKKMISEDGREEMNSIQLSLAESLLKLSFNDDYQKASKNILVGVKAVRTISTLHNEENTRINAILAILKTRNPSDTLCQQCLKACINGDQDLVYYLLLHDGVDRHTNDYRDILRSLIEYRNDLFRDRKKGFVLLLKGMECKEFHIDERYNYFALANDINLDETSKNLLYSSSECLLEDMTSYISKYTEKQANLIKTLQTLSPQN